MTTEPKRDAARLVASLEDMGRVPLDKIDPEQAKKIIHDVLMPATLQPPVEVAKFGSAL